MTQNKNDKSHRELTPEELANVNGGSTTLPQPIYPIPQPIPLPLPLPLPLPIDPYPIPCW